MGSIAVANGCVECGDKVRCKGLCTKHYKMLQRVIHRESDYARHKRWRDANREHVNAKARENYAKNPAAYLARNARWASTNAEKDRARRRVRALQYYHENVDDRRLYARKRYAANREALLAIHRAYMQDNPDVRRANQATRRARAIGAGGQYCAADVASLYEKQCGLCAACRVLLTKENLRVDHKTALARGGSNGPENIQLLCQPCNQRKHAKSNELFMAEMGVSYV